MTDNGLYIPPHTAGGIAVPGYEIPAEDCCPVSARNIGVTFPPQNDGRRNSMPDFLGANHIWPEFSLSGADTISDGGLTTLELGSRTIKTYITDYYRQNYKADKWPETDYSSPAELADCEYYRKLFSLDIHTYVIGAYIFDREFGHPAVYFNTQFPEKARRLEYSQLYDLTYYLCKTYAGTGKTFIIQNWESDWACVSWSEDRKYPTQDIFDRMIRWANTRQDAVSDARRDADSAGVNVFHAIEVNRVGDGMDGHPCVLTGVVPYTYCDFYAYSCYDMQESDDTFVAALKYIEEYVAKNRAAGASKCYIGEFGWPSELGEEKRAAIAERVPRIARSFGWSHAYWWELYGQLDSTFRLVTPDGKHTPEWQRFQDLLRG